jgi:hypothetical protein
VRATTARFWIVAEGVATRELKFAWPRELCCVGLSPTEFVTCAPFKDASVMCIAPRLMDCPLTNVLRFATVTARALCAYA